MSQVRTRVFALATTDPRRVPPAAARLPRSPSMSRPLLSEDVRADG
jgi:hypothetical protein